MKAKLYDILTDSNLTQSQVAQAALEIVKASSNELFELRKLAKACRDSKATCKYPEVVSSVEDFIDASRQRLVAEIWLAALVDQ